MLYLIYFIVIFLANSIGALSGMGGGVIIKPALDAIGAHSLATIGFFSSASVFTMSLVSILKQVRGGFAIERERLIAIATGSILGGFLGNALFNYLMSLFTDQTRVNLIQIAIMIATLIFAIIYTRSSQPTLGLRSHIWYFLTCVTIGIISTLLGIGGGPINVAAFMLVFGHTTKESTVYSIFTIFFSQLSKLGTSLFAGGLAGIDPSFLLVILPAAVLGGFVGSSINQKMSNEKIDITYQLIMILVICLNIYNAWKLLA